MPASASVAGRYRSGGHRLPRHARLFQKALGQLGIERAIVYGHSWGTLVALALAFEFPAFVRGLVLASGFYYPTVRADAFLFSPPALPVIGDAMRWTISPLIARGMSGLASACRTASLSPAGAPVMRRSIS